MWKLALLPLAAALLLRGEKVEILRDEFGVPHIFASTAAGAAYGSGYAQASDRLEELMRNFRKAEGTMAEVFGEQWFRHDWRQRLWGHRRIARERYPEISPKVRAIIEAYIAGIRKYMAEHPERVPAWAVQPEPWHVVAFGRFTIWGWPEGEAAGDLRRAGIPPDPLPYSGSNQMLIAPSRTALGAPIAIIDPHLSWYGETRYYEMRIYGGELAYVGGARLGLPFPTLGHGRHCSVAMTTGGPDTSDVYEERIENGRYRFKDEWRALERFPEKIGVTVDGRIEWRQLTVEATHHGPVWIRHNDKSYSMATPYAGEVRLVEQAHAMVTAKNLAEMKRALAMRQYMAQNIMVGTVDGDIYYLRNGRVPIRPKGCDPSRPQPGWTGECEWVGLHALEDLVQILNPPHGYMQNNNISPFAMMKDSPLVPEKYAERPYLYNAGRTPPHQRAAMTLEQLHNNANVTLEQALDFAFSPEIHQAALWQRRIGQAAPSSEFARALAGWNRRTDADSRPALGFYLFKMALGAHARAVEPPAALDDEQIRSALASAEARLGAEFPPDAVWGTLFRVGREGSPRTFPVSGGNVAEAGMATPRNIGFRKSGSQMVGTGGQSMTTIVALTRPPQSFMVIPLGESDHKDSPHFDDQAEKLFSKSRAKPTWFLQRKELEKRVSSRLELNF